MKETRKLNILQISTYDNKGGAAKIAWMLKQELEKRGHTTSMFVKHKLSTASNVYQIKNNFLQRVLSVAFASDLDFFQSNHILQTRQYREADIIHCHNLHGYYFNLTTLQKMAQEKIVVWTLHDEWSITPHCAYSLNGSLKTGFYQCPSRKLYPEILWSNEKYLQWRKKRVYKNVHLEVVVPCHWLEQKVKASILKNQRISLIYYGVDVTIFKKYPKKETRQKLSLPVDKKIITFLVQGGRNNPWKGWEYAQEIISNYYGNKDILLLCIGGSLDDQRLSSKNIRYIPFIFDNSLLAQYYSSSDVFLLTSLADNFPNTVLEAMACGVPVVSFDVGGVKEAVIHKKNGYIAKHKNIHDLIKGIEYIFNLNKNDIETISLNSIQRIEDNFSLEKMTENYINLYQSLIRK